MKKKSEKIKIEVLAKKKKKEVYKNCIDVKNRKLTEESLKPRKFCIFVKSKKID